MVMSSAEQKLLAQNMMLDERVKDEPERTGNDLQEDDELVFQQDDQDAHDGYFDAAAWNAFEYKKIDLSVVHEGENDGSESDSWQQ